jgi:hypothetical protein
VRSGSRPGPDELYIVIIAVVYYYNLWLDCHRTTTLRYPSSLSRWSRSDSSYLLNIEEVDVDDFRGFMAPLLWNNRYWTFNLC